MRDEGLFSIERDKKNFHVNHPTESHHKEKVGILLFPLKSLIHNHKKSYLLAKFKFSEKDGVVCH